MFYHYFDMDTPRLRGEKVFSNNLIVNNYSVKTKGKISHSDGANSVVTKHAVLTSVHVLVGLHQRVNK